MEGGVTHHNLAFEHHGPALVEPEALPCLVGHQIPGTTGYEPLVSRLVRVRFPEAVHFKNGRYGQRLTFENVSLQERLTFGKPFQGFGVVSHPVNLIDWFLNHRADIFDLFLDQNPAC